MATTTKTLTPTNQTITLPDMTERPNASILVDGIGKDADAINALSDQMANNSMDVLYVVSSAHTVNGKIAVSGKLVCLNMSVTLTANVNAWDTFATITQNKPISNGSYACIVNNEAKLIFISSGGNIQFAEAHNSGETVYINLSYITT